MKHWMLGRELTPLEKEFEQYITDRGLRFAAQTIYPRDDEDFEPFEVMVIMAERKVGEKFIGFQMTVNPIQDWRPAWDMCIELCNAGLDRTIEEQTCASA